MTALLVVNYALIRCKEITLMPLYRLNEKYHMKIFFVILMMSYSILGSTQDASEIVRFDQTTLDLGVVKKGSKESGQFVFTNISKDDITIDIVSTCECTQAKWTTASIKPGKKGKIEFVFDTTKKDEEEPVDIDIYFLNTNPKTGNPYSAYVQYTFRFQR